MQDELESLERRITTLEDEELEVMERLEDAQKDLDSLAAQVAAADERLAVARAPPATRRPAALDAELAEPGRRARPGRRRAAGRPAGALRQAARRRRAASAPPSCAPASAAAAGSPSTTPSSAVIRATPERRGDPLRGVPADPGAHRRVRVCDRRRSATAVVIEADGGSRGNPGPAAYGAVLKDAETGEVHRRGRHHDRASRPTTSPSTPA